QWCCCGCRSAGRPRRKRTSPRPPPSREHATHSLARRAPRDHILSRRKCASAGAQATAAVARSVHQPFDARCATTAGGLGRRLIAFSYPSTSAAADLGDLPSSAPCGCSSQSMAAIVSPKRLDAAASSNPILSLLACVSGSLLALALAAASGMYHASENPTTALIAAFSRIWSPTGLTSPNTTAKDALAAMSPHIAVPIVCQLNSRSRDGRMLSSMLSRWYT